MRVLFDHKRSAYRQCRGSGFDVFLTADKRIRYQQNLKGRRIAVVDIGNPTWRILRRHLDRVTAAVEAAIPGSYNEVFIPFD
jgi:hypothetical protein